MGRLVLIWRLAARSVRRRPAEALLTVLAVAAATTTLTLGLALYGVTSRPYEATRAATSGPDIVAMPNLSPLSGTSGPVRTSPANISRTSDMGRLLALSHAGGVTAHGGPYPVSFPLMRIGGSRVLAIAEGRGQARAPVDQPDVTQGSWVRPGGVVIERGFADELGARVGDRITLNGRPFRVTGLAVTAAVPAYPQTLDYIPTPPVPVWSQAIGLIWLTEPAARALATPSEPVSYMLSLKLAHPGSADAFARAHSDDGRLKLASWLGIRNVDGQQLRPEQRGLLIFSWLLGLLAIASLAVVVGGRMAEQTRRIGLIKAVGGGSRMVASVLLAEYLGLAVVAAAAGLLAGWLAAPFLTRPSAALVGSAGAPSVAWSTAGWAVLLALVVAIAAALVPSVRAARTSTTSALADAARRPRRRKLLIAAAARLPAPLLLGLRLAVRRPRRMLLTLLSVTITVMTVVAVLTVHAHLALHASTVNNGPGGLYSIPRNPNTAIVDRVLEVITVVLVLLALVNAVVITWATAVDSRQPLAVARALGTSPLDVGAALMTALLLPALPGAVAGLPLGVLLVRAVSHGSQVTAPPAWWLAAAFAVVLLALAVLSAVPARISARQPVTGILQSELA